MLQCIMPNAQCSVFVAQCSMRNTQRPIHNVPRLVSIVDAHCSILYLYSAFRTGEYATYRLDRRWWRCERHLPVPTSYR
eukprot:20397-Eustigmatos_ZCMA.PRE.2